MRTRNSLYYLRPIRPNQTAPPPPPMTPETAPERLIWLDANAPNVSSRGGSGFNGTNQNFSIASNASLQIQAAFWCSAWVRFNTATAGQTLISKDGAGSEQDYVLLWSAATNNLRFFVWGNSQSWGVEAPVPVTPQAGVWYFLVAYFDLNAQQIGISVDGGPFTTAQGPTGMTTSNAAFQLGMRSGTSPNPLNGRLDNAAIGKVPAASFVAIRDALYNGGSGRSYNQLTAQQRIDFGLVSFWELDELSGNRIDSHGSNHLAPINGPTAVDGIVTSPADNLDPVWSWVDPSNATVFNQATVANRPTWRSEGYLAFDGADDRLSRSAGPVVGDKSAFTLLARVRMTSLPATNPAVVYTEADAAGNVVNRLAINAAGNVVASYRPSGGTLASATSAGTLAVGTNYVIGVRRDGTSLQLFVDGVPSGPAATIAGGSDLTGATARVGGPVESSGLAHFNGRVEAIFAVGQALSDAHVQDLSSAL